MQHSARTKLEERYELKEILGRGGMGLVYRARDLVLNRDVALKTLLEVDNPTTLDLFYKECGVLAEMVHPNIISIYDMGGFQQDGVTKPFFTMPLLPGSTLDQLIKDGRKRCNVAAVVDIISQACRGLHAAHEMQLVHRDIKPSNIFVLDDDSVKIIDFGIARSASAASRTALKGTLYYMAPEQIHMKAPSALTDQYALAVVCYEALTGQRPFQGATDRELAEAILYNTPTPISELNSDVSRKVSQVIHRAFAKDALHRFPDVREFGSALQRSFRNEPLPYFEIGKIRARLDRAAASLANGDFDFASELLSEIESEGYLDEEISSLRRDIDRQVSRSRISRLLTSAQNSLDAGEFVLALRKVTEALQQSPGDEAARALKGRIERAKQEQKFQESVQQAQELLNQRLFTKAREAVESVLSAKPTDTQALALLAELNRQEQDNRHVQDRKIELYKAAQQNRERGNLSSSLTKLGNLLELEERFPDPNHRQAEEYRKLYQAISSERDEVSRAYEQAVAAYRSGDYDRALTLCTQTLAQHPSDSRFHALKIDVEQAQRKKVTQFIAEVHAYLETEPDLNLRVAKLEEAIAQYPEELHFQNLLRPAKEKRDLVQSILKRAQQDEERQDWEAALDQWKTIGSIDPANPLLSAAVSRLQSQLAGAERHTAKLDLTAGVRRALELFDYPDAERKLSRLAAEFPDDEETSAFCSQAGERVKNGIEASRLVAQASRTIEQTKTSQGLPMLRDALHLDPANSVIQGILVNCLLQSARETAPSNANAAADLVREAVQLEPENTAALALSRELAQRSDRDFIAWCTAQARELESQGDIEGALVIAAKGLESHPDDIELRALQADLVHHREKSQRRIAAELADAEQKRLAASEVPAVPASALVADAVPKPSLDPAVPAFLSQSSQDTPSEVEEGKRRFPWKWGLAGLACAAAAGAAFLFWPKPSSPSPTDPEVAAFVQAADLRIQPPNATLLVDGKACGTGTCNVSLASGTHTIAGTLPGYAAAEKTVTVARGGAAPAVALVLVPVVPKAVFSSNLAGARFTFDGAPVTADQGSIALDIPKAGPHTMLVAAEGFQRAVRFSTAVGSKPAVQPPVPQTRFVTTIGAGVGSSLQVYSSLVSAELMVDGKPAGQLKEGQTTVTGLADGSHDLQLTDDGISHHLLLTTGSAPVLSAFVGDPRQFGSLRIESNQDDIRISLNGSEMKQTTHNGRLLARLPERTYIVRAEKDGFTPITISDVKVRQQQDTKISFAFVPQQSLASLVVRNAPPGATVSLDGKKLGTVHPNGELTVSGIEAGRKTVTISLPSYKTVASALDFTAGKETVIADKLELAGALVKIEVSPATLHPVVTVRRGDEPLQTLHSLQETLPDGSYLISGHAPGYEVATAAVTVHGSPVSVPLIFKQTSVAPPQEAPHSFTMSVWEKTSGWKIGDGMLSRTGGGIVLSPFSGSAGTYVFSVFLPKGKRVSWIVNYRDEKNYVVYQLDSSHLTTTEFVDGSKQKNAKVPLKLTPDQNVTITATVKDESVVTSLEQGIEKLVNIGRVSSPDGHYSRGRFAFLVPGKEALILQSFRFGSS